MLCQSRAFLDWKVRARRGDSERPRAGRAQRQRPAGRSGTGPRRSPRLGGRGTRPSLRHRPAGRRERSRLPHAALAGGRGRLGATRDGGPSTSATQADSIAGPERPQRLARPHDLPDTPGTRLGVSSRSRAAAGWSRSSAGSATIRAAAIASSSSSRSLDAPDLHEAIRDGAALVGRAPQISVEPPPPLRTAARSSGRYVCRR